MLPAGCASAAGGAARRLRVSVTMHPMALHHMVESSSLKGRGDWVFYHRPRMGFHSKRQSLTLGFSRWEWRERRRSGRYSQSAANPCSAEPWAGIVLGNVLPCLLLSPPMVAPAGHED